MLEQPSDTGCASSPGVEFTMGDWFVQPTLNRVSKGGTTIHLRPQLIDVLVCLASTPGQTVLRGELLDRVWPNQFVAETALARCVAELRQALGDDAQCPALIETIPKRGYRLIAPVALASKPVALSDGGPESGNGNGNGGGPARPAPPEGPALTARVTDDRPRHSVEDSDPGSGLGAPSTIGPRLRPRLLALAIAGAAVAAMATSVGWLVVTRPAAAKAPLAERDPVVVAFTNTTGDPVFDGALRLALAIHLEQSPYLRLTPERTMQETLRFLGQPATAAVTPDMALQVCERVGASAVLHGSIAPMGQHYVVGLEAIACVSHDTVARAQAEAAGREHVLEALTRAANSLRRRLGESIASIARFDVPLVQATTPSLEALRAVSLGDREQFRGAYAEALQQYRQATVIDPDFALAWARTGVTLLNLRRRGEARVPLTRAFDLRERVSEPERLYIAGHYYNGVLESPLRALDAFSALSRSTARATPARINLSSIYQQIGLWEQAIEEARTAVDLEPENVVAHVVLAGALTGAGRFDEALAALAAAGRRGLQSPSTHDLRHDLGFLMGDEAVVREEDAYATREPSMAPFLLTRRARMAMYRGRLREASGLWSRVRADAEGRQDDVAASAALLSEAGSRALIGDRAGTSRALSAALTVNRNPSRVAQSALVLALAGDVAGARRYLAEYERRCEPGSDRDLEFVVPARAALAVAEGRFADAGPLLESVRPYELGTRFEYLPLFIRAHAALGMRAYGDAAQAFQAILDNPGVLPYSVFQTLAWLGRARAYAGLGQPDESLRSYDAALQIWNDADPDLPLLATARREAAALRGR